VAATTEAISLFQAIGFVFTIVVLASAFVVFGASIFVGIRAGLRTGENGRARPVAA